MCIRDRANGKGIDVFKDPITDTGKRSKKGRLDLEIFEGRYETVPIPNGDEKVPYSILQTVFLNGKMVREYTFDEVRKSASL